MAITVAMIGLLLGCASRTRPAAPAPPPSIVYLSQLHDGVNRARQQMPAIIESAQNAAQRYARGGRIFAAGSQEEFARELIDRNGGLAEIGIPPARLERIRRGDVILFGARSQLSMVDRFKIACWREAGAYVVAFASRAQRDPYFPPDDLIDSGDAEGMLLAEGRICPTDGAINLINAWTWTGEFISACTRLKKPTVIAGPTRVAYRTSSDPIPAGVLGMQYLDAVERAIATLQNDSADALREGGQWLREADHEGARMLVVCRLYPEHFTDVRGPRPIADVRAYQKGRVALAPLTLVLAGQNPPQLAIDAAHLRRTRLIYSSPEQARDDRSDYILYLNPHCPGDDGCVKVSGYNAPALPIGTVMRSAIYWATVAEALEPPAARK